MTLLSYILILDALFVINVQWLTSVIGYEFGIYVSQFTVETYCFADGRCLFKQLQSVIYHWNQHDEEISKKCRSVRPSVSPTVCRSVRLSVCSSVCLSVCNANKKAYSSFIIDSSINSHSR